MGWAVAPNVLEVAKAVRKRVAAATVGESDKRELLRCADEDVAEARAIWAWLDDVDGEVDELDFTLYSLLGLLYLDRIFELCPSEREMLPISHLDCLLDFARELEPESFSGIHQEKDVSELLELLWINYCGFRGLRVSSVTLSEERELSSCAPLAQPWRAPQNDLCLGSLTYQTTDGCGEEQQADGGRQPSRSKLKLILPQPEVPKFFDFFAKIIESDYFSCLPSRVEGYATCKVLGFVRSRLSETEDPVWKQLEEVTSSMYKRPFKLEKTERLKFYHDEPLSLLPLSIEDVVKILRALRCSGNTLLRRLLLERPPKSKVAHRMALTDCVEHARLWLSRLDLRIYYNLSLTYGELCTREAHDAEEEALEHGFEVEKWPSPLEKALRVKTFASLWTSSGTFLCNARPVDYADCPDTNLCKALKNLGFPIHVSAAGKPKASMFILVRWYAPLLQYEDKSKLEWLFKGGKPADDEIASAIAQFMEDSACKDSAENKDNCGESSRSSSVVAPTNGSRRFCNMM